MMHWFSTYLLALLASVGLAGEKTHMKFHEVATYFSQLEHVSSRLEMTRILAELLKKAAPSDARIICNLSLGQLHAVFLGTQFNMAEKSVAKAIADLLGKTDKEILEQAKQVGDLALVIPLEAWQAQKKLTVQEVYDALCTIEQLGGTGSQEEKVNALTALLQDVDPLSARFIVRIVIGKLRLGFSDMTIVDALSWMQAGDKSLRAIIENAYNVCADIGFIASELKERGVEAIEHVTPQVGVPILPAAAERAPTAKDIFERLGVCIAQPKLDGFRLQIHVDKTGDTPIIKFYSRNLQDMSHMFPDLTEVFEKIPVQTLICEGEAIVYDAVTHQFSKFQETVKRKRKHGIEQAMSDFPLQIFLFDILYLNGKQVMDQTHAQRRILLEKTFNGVDHLIHVIEEKPINSTQELEDYFNSVMSLGLEGLVVKRPDALYQPGKRNFNWIKYKRTAQGHLEDTVDVAILGYYAGEGKRAAFGIGAFLVGVYDKDNDRFETIAKVGTGLKDDDWKELKRKCDAITVLEQPKNVYCSKELFPDVWVNPEIICTVFADEITVSPLHTAGKTTNKLGYALRFPRFMGYRSDKSATEATSVIEIEHMYQDQFKK